jgi:hypothetical protein
MPINYSGSESGSDSSITVGVIVRRDDRRETIMKGTTMAGGTPMM